MERVTVAIGLAASYVLGSVPIGLVAVRAARGIDIRQYGSGNIGTVNVLRVGGPLVAVAVLVLDAIKGFLPTYLLSGGAAAWTDALGLSGEVLGPAFGAAAGLAAVAGHNWSAFLGLKGGKGVATGCGAVVAMSPAAAAVGLVVWALTVATTRYASLASILATASVPITLAWRVADPAWIALGLILLAFVLLRHRENIGRLLRGKELRITDRVS